MFINKTERLKVKGNTYSREYRVNPKEFGRTPNPSSIPTLFKEFLKRKSILIFGDFHLEERIIYGIAKQFGIPKENLVIMKDYKKNKRTSLRSLQWNPRYAGVLFGPVAHHTPDLTPYNSVSAMFKREEGFPPCQEITTLSGALKISKNAFENALKRLLSEILKENHCPASR